LHRDLDCLFVEKASWGQAKACQFLMKYLLNGNPYASGARYTALHIAARNGHLKVVQLILKHEKRPWMLNSKAGDPKDFGRTS
jgi:ankyrin repeat protein